MSSADSSHDPGTAMVDRDATNGSVDAVLARLRLAGAIFLRAEYREPWAYESMDCVSTARALRAGSDRVILFHVVATGACWIQVGDGEKLWARAGDVIVLPYGDQHRMGGTDEADVVPLSVFLIPPPWQTMPVLRHGRDGARTDVVCGYLSSADPLFDAGLRALPPVFVVRPDATAAAWVRASIEYSLNQVAGVHGGAAASRLPELMLVEVLRLYLTSHPLPAHGWFAALHDPILGPALGQLHRCPERKWTVAELADAVAVSRSLLDLRFRTVLGRPPIRYLTEWRMRVAGELLGDTDLSVAAVARRVGYDAEEAFSRAFKRETGTSPSAWRNARRVS
ncbi:AraC family transcriptional regulator [Nocardia yamanashiensis]|uniref:AraC family transcriptional regulator n=1 Tax=Nocardia yamanashiensis TaxID=209247 RepID=UPI001E384DA2|nr:AraC family transcriptional regulator [Nocardia yamanashiensis]UGT42058.1 AraC family transcriptional regulator [Nocardia yamanashiensis]